LQSRRAGYYPIGNENVVEEKRWWKMIVKNYMMRRGGDERSFGDLWIGKGSGKRILATTWTGEKVIDSPLPKVAYPWNPKLYTELQLWKAMDIGGIG
jgi:hypothetical protein